MNTINLQLIKKNPLTLQVLLAEKLGLFAKHRVTVNLSTTEDFPFNGNTPFFTGESDAMVGDTTFFFYMLKRGKKAVITSDLTRTIHLVGGRQLPNDLRHLKIGANRAGLLRLFLENDLKEMIPHAEITWINNSYERLQALENGEIDALVAIDPFVTDVTEAGGKIIWSLRNSHHNFVMWAFDEEFYHHNQEAVANFYQALEETTEIFNAATTKQKVQYARDCGYNEELSQRFETFTFEKQSAYRVEDFNLCQEWMYRNGEINELYDPNQYIVNPFKK